MQRALDSFRNNLVQARNLEAVHQFLVGAATPALDVSDLLRSELVFAVSAFDLSIHDMVRLGLANIHLGLRPRTPGYEQFQVSIAVATQWVLNPSAVGWLEAEIRERHSFRSFQKADNVAQAIALISNVRLWDTVGQELGESAKDVRLHLDLVVDRRNKIAHEADGDPSTPGARWPIQAADVSASVDFLARVGEAIFKAT